MLTYCLLLGHVVTLYGVSCHILYIKHHIQAFQNNLKNKIKQNSKNITVIIVQKYQIIVLANKYELQLGLNLTFIKTALNTF